MKAMTFTGCSLLAVLALAGGTASAQPTAASAPQTVRTGVPQRDTLNKLMRRISVDFQEKRLEDVIAFVKDFSTADIEPFWIDDQHTEGLDKEKVITVKVDNVSVLSLLEKVLEKAHPDSGGEATWQMSEQGTCQIGPRDRLNKYRRIQIYDINDLLMELPNYTDVPHIDLQQALQASQSGGGGGGSQSPFQNDQNREDPAAKQRNKQVKADDLAGLIRDLVEPEQWTENGGSGGSIRYYQGTLIVNAADYIHRGIDGYRYWPGAQTVAMKDMAGRRYVTLTGDTGLSKINGIAQQPVSAVVGGQIIRSNDPGGGR
jgi:hypothetical protein